LYSCCLATSVALQASVIYSSHHRVQNSSGAQPASYPMGTRGSFPGGKAARACSWPPTSIYCRGQRMSGDILPLPQYVFIAWCLSPRDTSKPVNRVEPVPSGPLTKVSHPCTTVKYLKVKAKLSLFLQLSTTPWRCIGGVEYSSFLTSGLDTGERSASRPSRFTPREREPCTHWIEGWMGSRAVLDAVVKRKIPSPRRKSNPRIPIVHPIKAIHTKPW
jgi:hypothetical protein